MCQPTTYSTFYCLVSGDFVDFLILILHHGPWFTKRTDRLSYNLVKNQNDEVWCEMFYIALKIDRGLGNCAAELPVNFHSSRTLILIFCGIKTLQDNLKKIFHQLVTRDGEAICMLISVRSWGQASRVTSNTFLLANITKLYVVTDGR